MVAVFDYHYRKSINLTAWILQILICLLLLAMSAWVISVVNDDEYDQYFEGYGGAFNIAGGVLIGLTGLTIVLDIAEIVLVVRSRMQPALYLTSACIKTLIWIVLFIMEIIGLEGLGIILTGILAGTAIMQLIYGSILVHHKRRGTLTGGKYAMAANPAVVDTGYGYQGTEYKPTGAYQV